MAALCGLAAWMVRPPSGGVAHIQAYVVGLPIAGSQALHACSPGYDHPSLRYV